ncbi:MAG TPA: MlaD family protein [Solirubrobacterales bacterium]|jgi:phospholipid/cholesterol/gamma-HCH transport system substrate-binding protein|nr:MlaD family protein [Solirubrobacterales bacterium]
MKRAIREHLRDFLAIIALVIAGVVTMFVILANQSTALPSWFPILGEDRFEVKAKFSSAQAVTPGQGQAVMIAGIKVGDITGVTLDDGQAEVTMDVDYDKAGLITDEASLLLRPKTGLNDMVIEVSPGTGDESVEEGDTIPLASTQPNVNPDEVLASLDADTQAFLKLLLAGGAEALDPEKGRDRKLGNALRQFEPFARDIARLTGKLAQRRDSISRSIHNFRLLSEELAARDTDLISFVEGSNGALERFANQEANLRESLRELPSTLAATDDALASGSRFAVATLPALRDSLPGARALRPALRAARPFLRRTAAPIRKQIRPFTRQVYDPVVHLRQATEGLGDTVPGLKSSFQNLNAGLNALAFNPPGTNESFLFYLPWVNHNTNNLFLLQDAHGPLRRGIVLQTCESGIFSEALAGTRPAFKTVLEVTNQPRTTEIC